MFLFNSSFYTAPFTPISLQVLLLNYEKCYFCDHQQMIQLTLQWMKKKLSPPSWKMDLKIMYYLHIVYPPIGKRQQRQ